MTPFNEDTVEQAALEWLGALGYEVRHGQEIAPGAAAAERDDYGQVVLAGRLRAALARLNPDLPPAALDDAFRKLNSARPAVARRQQPRPAPPAGRRRHRGVHRRRWPHRRGAGPRAG